MDEMSEELEDNIRILFPSGPRTFLVRGRVDKKSLSLFMWLGSRSISGVATNKVCHGTLSNRPGVIFLRFYFVVCFTPPPFGTDLFFCWYWSRFKVSWAVTGIWEYQLSDSEKQLSFRRRQNRFSIYRRVAHAPTPGRMKSLLLLPTQWWRAVGAVVLSVLRFTQRKMLHPMLER